MSLIHEALRKARREAAHHDDPGVVYPGGLTGSRQPRGIGTGFVLGVSAAVIICAILAGALWWGLRTPSDSPSSAIAANSPTESEDPADEPTTQGESATRPEDTRSSDESESATSPADEGAGAEEAVQSAPTSLDVTTLAQQQAEPESHQLSGAAPESTASDLSTNSGERVFEVEADLGYAALSLDYIVFRATDSYAQINGFDVRVGSHVEGFTVEEITAEWVRLKDDRGPLVLKVPDDIATDGDTP